MTADRTDVATRHWLSPPTDTPLYMYPAWVGALHHALGDDTIMEDFRGETGMLWRPGRTPIERHIDKATGAEEKFLRAFVPWFNERVWEPID